MVSPRIPKHVSPMTLRAAQRVLFAQDAIASKRFVIMEWLKAVRIAMEARREGNARRVSIVMAAGAGLRFVEMAPEKRENNVIEIHPVWEPIKLAISFACASLRFVATGSLKKMKLVKRAVLAATAQKLAPMIVPVSDRMAAARSMTIVPRDIAI